MPVAITETLLSDLGFVQQNPSYIWDYPMSDEHDYFRFSRMGNDWYFGFRGQHGVLVLDLMAVIRIIAIMAYTKGIQEMQDKFQESLGLDRLLEKFVDRIRNDDD